MRTCGGGATGGTAAGQAAPQQRRLSPPKRQPVDRADARRGTAATLHKGGSAARKRAHAWQTRSDGADNQRPRRNPVHLGTSLASGPPRRIVRDRRRGAAATPSRGTLRVVEASVRAAPFRPKAEDGTAPGQVTPSRIVSGLQTDPRDWAEDEAVRKHGCGGWRAFHSERIPPPFSMQCEEPVSNSRTAIAEGFMDQRAAKRRKKGPAAEQGRTHALRAQTLQRRADQALKAHWKWRRGVATRAPQRGYKRHRQCTNHAGKASSPSGPGREFSQKRANAGSRHHG